MVVPASTRESLDPNVIRAFRTDGYARLGKIIDDRLLKSLRRRSRELMTGEHVVPGLFFQHDAPSGRYADLSREPGFVGPSERYRKIEKLERDDVFRALIEHDRFRVLTNAILGPRVSLYRATLFNKAPLSSEIPWHQDAGAYWGLDREPELQIWTALDDATRQSGCLEVIVGSHLSGLVTPLGGVLPEAAVASSSAAKDALMLEARAGEVILLHNLVWHRSGNNRSEKPRRAVSICYLDAATRCLRRRRAPREFVRVFE